jgi:glucan-binding YG repeat protein
MASATHTASREMRNEWMIMNSEFWKLWEDEHILRTGKQKIMHNFYYLVDFGLSNDAFSGHAVG